MKFKMMLLFILMGCVSAVMGQTSLVNKVINGINFESISVSGPVSVELIESANASVEAVGNYDFINNIQTSWTNKLLSITFTKDESRDGQPPIRVYVNKLTAINAENGAKILTPKPLHSPNIRLTMSGDSYARIVNYGGIKVVSDQNTLVRSFPYKPE